MSRKPFFKTQWILLFLTGIFVACQNDDSKPTIQFENVIVNNEGEFTFKDSLTYFVNDTLQYEIKFKTAPEDVKVYYSKNAEDFQKLSDEWILMDSSFKFLQFYGERQGYNSQIHKIDFSFGNEEIEPTINLYPNPVKDTFKIEFGRNLRGSYRYQIFNLTGKILISGNGFVGNEEFGKSIDLGNLFPHIYFIRFQMGNSVVNKKIIKE